MHLNPITLRSLSAPSRPSPAARVNSRVSRVGQLKRTYSFPSTSYVSSLVCHRIAVLVVQGQMLELGETRKAMIHLTRLCSTPIKHFERLPFVFGKFGLTETMTRSTRSSSLSLSLSTHPSGGSASRVSCRPRAITAYRQP